MAARLLCIWLAVLAPSLAWAGNVRVAVASNFLAPLEALAETFEAQTGHDLVVSSGATGLLYAQIVNGAPFDVFLAADQARPAALVSSGLAVAGTQATYASGRLYLQTRITKGQFPQDYRSLRWARRIALANPRTAPYGAAATQVLTTMQLNDPQIARASNIAGVSALMAAGAADAGFVAYSSVTQLDPRPSGWLIPAELHDPLHQDAVLLARAADTPGARAFLDWLTGAKAKDLIRSYGYDID